MFIFTTTVIDGVPLLGGWGIVIRKCFFLNLNFEFSTFKYIVTILYSSFLTRYPFVIKTPPLALSGSSP